MICITGATGMVGAHLMVQLSNKGETIRALKRTSSDLQYVRKIFTLYAHQPEEQWNAIEWVISDLNDIGSLEDALDQVKQVYHCAAVVSFNTSERQKIMQTNVEGTANLVNILLQKDGVSLCHVSSIAALGYDEKHSFTDEQTEWKKRRHQSVYALSKHAAEREIWRGIAEGLNAVIVNPSVILGPGNWQSGSSELFALVWRGMPFYTEGITGYVDVRDVVKAMIMLMEKKLYGQRYIISSENLSYRQLFTWIAEGLKKKPPHIHVHPWIGELAWRWYWLIAKVQGKKPAITKETARSSQTIRYFTAEKISSQTAFQFIPMQTSIDDICRQFLADHDQK